MDARDGAVMSRAYAGSIRTYVHNYTQAPMSSQNLRSSFSPSLRKLGQRRFNLGHSTEAAYTLT